MSRQPDGQLEIFHSIQGEGINAGTPAVFLRLALCNLKCSWCDTKYTWDWEHYDQGKEVTAMSWDEVETEILKHECKHVVITGGEPLIQHRELMPLLKSLRGKGFYIEIESNGTIVPEAQFVALIDQWNISPKLANSGNPLPSREIPRAYRFFTDLPSSFFIYVIQSEGDLFEVQGLVEKYHIPSSKVILMPEAIDRETLLKRGSWLAELCKHKGYKFSTRLQILLWDNRRGV